jgi:hypothetical protein
MAPVTGQTFGHAFADGDGTNITFNQRRVNEIDLATSIKATNSGKIRAKKFF